jgi:hypothetical protein
VRELISSSLPAAGEAGPVEAVLEGGPAGLGADQRHLRLAAAVDKVKVPFCGGYEHFERDDAVTGSPLVFRWTTRTRVAE